MIATKASDKILKILNLQLKEKAELKFEERIDHILHLSENLFLVLSENGIFKVDAFYLEMEKIELEEAPKQIHCGTVLKKDHYFLYVKAEDKIFEGRTYNLQGKLISRIKIPPILK